MTNIITKDEATKYQNALRQIADFNTRGITAAEAVSRMKNIAQKALSTKEK